MIEEESIRFVAAADWTDECRVDVRMRRKHMDLSAAQARQFAAELVGAAEQAERAGNEAVRPVEAARFDLLGQVTSIADEIGATIEVEHLSPDCKAGKHPGPAWLDSAWDNGADIEVPCSCPCHVGETAA